MNKIIKIKKIFYHWLTLKLQTNKQKLIQENLHDNAMFLINSKFSSSFIWNSVELIKSIELSYNYQVKFNTIGTPSIKYKMK